MFLMMLPLPRPFILLRLVATTTPPISSRLTVCVAADLQVWLFNDTEEEVAAFVGELFGFNTGVVSEKPFFPWIVEWDAEMMVEVSDAGKTCRSLAHIACNQAPDGVDCLGA